MQAIECLIRACDVIEAPSGRSCAEAAERAINHLDFKLDREGVSDPLEAPEMKDEVQRQRQMLTYLASNPVLESGPAGTARMFRG